MSISQELVASGEIMNGDGEIIVYRKKSSCKV